MKNDDLLNEAFGLLRAGSSEPATLNLDLEERMMKQLAKAQRPGMSRFTRAALVVLVCITLAGASVAATGGFSRILKNFTGTVETLDGVTYELRDGAVVDGEGNVLGTAEVEITTD